MGFYECACALCMGVRANALGINKYTRTTKLREHESRFSIRTFASDSDSTALVMAISPRL